MNFRERLQTPFKDSCYLSDEDSVICYGDMLVLTAGDPVFHFPFIQHTAAAVNDQLISADVIWKFCPGGKDKLRLLSSVSAYPVGNFEGSDIVALAMVGTAFGDQDPVSVPDILESGPAPSTAVFRSPLYRANRIEKEVRGISAGVSWGHPFKSLTVGDHKARADTFA